jgi:hypothetical protein
MPLVVIQLPFDRPVPSVLRACQHNYHFLLDLGNGHGLVPARQLE